MIGDIYLIKWQCDLHSLKYDVQLLICEWCVNVMCSYFLKCMTKLSSVPYEWLLHPLCSWVGHKSCIMYTHIIHTWDIKRHSFHTCIWMYDGFKTYLFLNKSLKKGIVDSSRNCFEIWGWFTYLKMNLNMWLKRRARMMAACNMGIITLDSETRRGGLLVCVTSPTPRAL